MPESRKRNISLSIRLTESEKEKIVGKAQAAGMKINEYIIAASLKTEIHPPLDLSSLLIELKRIGNNLNQITTKINAGAFRSADFHEVVAMQRALCDELRRIAKDGDDNSDRKLHKRKITESECDERRDRLLRAGQKGL